MRPAATNVQLLGNVPFFSLLSQVQLNRVVACSREWEVSPESLIDADAGTVQSGAPWWILLEGRWRIDGSLTSFESRNSEPGKWFSTAEAHGRACVLRATEHSFVMRIDSSDMQAMIKAGFPFEAHIEAGRFIYRRLFGRARDQVDL